MMKFKKIYIAHFIILVGFIWSLYYGINEFIINGISFGSDLDSILFTLKSYSFFKLPLLFILPVIGIFLRNKTGWFFISIFFYFVLSNIVVDTIFSKVIIGIEIDLESFVVVVVLLLFLLFILFILNRSQSSLDYYKISKSEFYKLNIIAFVVGFCVSISLYIYNNLHYFDRIY